MYIFSHAGTTAAKKLEGTSSGVDTDPFLFLLRPFPIWPSPTIALAPFHPFPFLLLVSPPLGYSYRRFGEICQAAQSAQRMNDNQLQKLEGTKYAWSPRSPKLEWTRPTGCAYGCRVSSSKTCKKLTSCRKRRIHSSNMYVGPSYSRSIFAARARPQQQTRRPPLLLSIDATDRRFMTLIAYCADRVIKPRITVLLYLN